MLLSYIKLALRNIVKEKIYSFINIIGLAIGIACSILILLYVKTELTYDTFHSNVEKIYRINHYWIDDQDKPGEPSSDSPIPLGKAIKEIPGVEEVVRFQAGEAFVKYDDKIFEENIFYADESFFKIFSFPLILGNSSTALNDPSSVILSKKISEKYFGNSNPVGQHLSIRLGNDYRDIIVTGVAEDIPDNSSIKFDFLLPYEQLNFYEWYRELVEDWTSFNSPVFIKIKPGISKEFLNQNLKFLTQKYYKSYFEEWRSAGFIKHNDDPLIFQTQALKEIHLDTSVRGGLDHSFEAPSDPIYSYILSFIALSVLLIACINYMNLSIGRSTSRSKEVGIRKVIGARRTQLMRQFWGETFVTIFISFLLGVTLAEFFLPVFNSLTNKNLILNYTNDWTTMEGLILLLVITGFVSGSYPALIFSGFKPVDTLKNRIHFGGSNLLTKSLVVIQFSLAVILIIAVVVVSSQLKYIKSKNLGFNREQVLIIPVTEGGIDSWRILEIYKNDFKSHKDILNISGTSNTFALGYHNVGFRNSKGEERRAYEYRIDHNYLATLGITLKEGRNFSKEFLTDSAESVIVNETLVKRFGIGKPVGNILDGFSRSDIQNPRIIGVVKDYNFESLHKEVEPVVLHLNKGSEISYILVRVSENNIPGTIDDINSKWNEIIPDIPFKYSFLDKDIEKQYRIEEQWHSIIIYAGGFAILTAVMGLFGLTALTVTKRTKEIGIRKVLGATISSIVTLISKQIIIQVLIANIIAAPLAYFAATKWLEDFAYKIDLSIIIFITAAFISVFIAFITISFQAIKAGLSNPVKSLRYE